MTPNRRGRAYGGKEGLGKKLLNSKLSPRQIRPIDVKLCYFFFSNLGMNDKSQVGEALVHKREQMSNGGLVHFSSDGVPCPKQCPPPHKRVRNINFEHSQIRETNQFVFCLYCAKNLTNFNGTLVLL